MRFLLSSRKANRFEFFKLEREGSFRNVSDNQEQIPVFNFRASEMASNPTDPRNAVVVKNRKLFQEISRKPQQEESTIRRNVK